MNTSGSLMDRLNNKVEQDRQQTETLVQEHFQTLSRNLRSASENALTTTERVITKQVSALEQRLTSQCQSLEGLFHPLNVRLLRWSCLLVAIVVLTIFSTLGIFRYLAADLRQEIAELRLEKDVLETNYAQVWRQFKGLETYEDGGKHYLLTGPGWVIELAGTLGKKNAWLIVREK